MTQRDDQEPSFDPRSWAAKTAAPPPQSPVRPVRPALGKGLIWAMAAMSGLAILAIGFILMARHPPAPGGQSAAVGARRSLVIAGPDVLAGALGSAGLPADIAVRASAAALGVIGPSPGELRVAVTFAPGSADRLQKLEVRRADGSGAVVSMAGATPMAQPLASHLVTRIKVVRGEMDADSFYSSAVAAGVTDSLIPDFAKAFAFDFDFQREIHPGDIFEAGFEQHVNGAGEPVGADRLVYASLETKDKSRALYRFQAPGDPEAAWFDGNGRSIVRSLMRTPVEGARISSSFGPRMHPVLGYTRLHKGTDFAAPVGTTVFASGDGVVDFVGPHGEHGNYVRIRHTPMLETAYAHLSAFGPGLRVGSAVRQGQPIALSGNTGLSSGPHLHYEVIVDGEPVDSMTFQTQSGRSLQGKALAAFTKARDQIDALRAKQNG